MEEFFFDDNWDDVERLFCKIMWMMKDNEERNKNAREKAKKNTEKHKNKKLIKILFKI